MWKNLYEKANWDFWIETPMWVLNRLSRIGVYIHYVRFSRKYHGQYLN